ncbi:MAG: DUF1929 domain-containing protein [Acidobacteria bacterium]|nr:DUF1929 domain-containing protein [Acidobacteriota bacterium]MBI3654871.1 DUF1929 domain-containing protein [Acidobacteriota bacterium]
MIRPGAATHAFDNEQRLVPLSITGQSSTTVNFAAPDNTVQGRYLAVPGYYYLFIMTGTGNNQIPSVAAYVKLTDPGDPPSAPRRR